MLTVEKRDQSVEPLDTSKIKQVIAWACEGLDINPLRLESACIGTFQSGVSTSFIQQSLITAASSFISLEEPDWKLVAGRLEVMNRWKETRISRGFAYYSGGKSTFKQHVTRMVNLGRYDARLLKFDLDEAGKWIVPSRDLDFEIAAANLLSTRYLVKDELPQEMFLAIALLLASVETESMQLIWARRFYELLSTKKVSLATPVLANLRVPNASLASCFTMVVDDNLGTSAGSITDVWRDAALISQNGGGLGVSVSNIRAKGSSLRGLPNRAKGVVPLIRVFNDIAVYIDQGGKRAGAFTIGLDAWHYDLLDFLELRTNAGDERGKARDIFPQVIIPDLLMQRAEANELWSLMCPFEVEQATGHKLAELHGEAFVEAYEEAERAAIRRLRIPAKDLVKKLVQLSSGKGEGTPYWAFKDRMNEYNPNDHEGIIPLLNLCVESFSVVKSGKYSHVCCLSSIVLTNIEDSEIREVTADTIRILDNVTTLSVLPTPSTAAHAQRYRTVGLGVMGLADWLALHELNYHSGADRVEELFEIMGHAAFEANIALGKERGNFPAFPGSRLNRGIVLGKVFGRVDGKNYWMPWSTAEHFFDHDPTQSEIDELLADLINSPDVHECQLDWRPIVDGIRNHARCSQLLSPAPNTSTAVVMGATPSILPVFMRMYTEKSETFIPKYIKEGFWHYTENVNYPQELLVKLVARMQRWIDTGISMELLINLDNPEYTSPQTGPRKLYDLYFSAWKEGCKAIYYTRTKKKKKTTAVEECTSCSG